MCEEDKKAEPPKDIAAELMSAVTYVYLNPIEDTADEDGHAQLKFLAEDFGMTPIKVRKMFITSGVYQTATSIKVNKLYTSGKSIRETQVAMGLCLLPSAATFPTAKPHIIWKNLRVWQNACGNSEKGVKRRNKLNIAPTLNTRAVLS